MRVDLIVVSSTGTGRQNHSRLRIRFDTVSPNLRASEWVREQSVHSTFSENYRPGNKFCNVQGQGLPAREVLSRAGASISQKRNRRQIQRGVSVHQPFRVWSHRCGR